MLHRVSHLSAAALLTVLLLLAAAPAWGQGEPTGEPSAQQEGQCPDGQVFNAQAGECERDRDCPEFDTREEALDFFESRGGPEDDPHRLNDDPEEDDIPCENLPSGDAGAANAGADDEATPSGGVDSGYGPVRAKAGAPAPLGLVGGGVAVLALVGLGVARTRHAG